MMKPKLFEKWIAEFCYHKNNPVRQIIEIEAIHLNGDIIFEVAFIEESAKRWNSRTDVYDFKLIKKINLYD
ncbi:MAG: hypothetical protein IKB70_08110 [Bacilli bacterium]|nr:hypothetical protein [Bacilli bacterium]